MVEKSLAVYNQSPNNDTHAIEIQHNNASIIIRNIYCLAHYITCYYMFFHFIYPCIGPGLACDTQGV